MYINLFTSDNQGNEAHKVAEFISLNQAISMLQGPKESTQSSFYAHILQLKWDII